MVAAEQDSYFSESIAYDHGKSVRLSIYYQRACTAALETCIWI